MNKETLKEAVGKLVSQWEKTGPIKLCALESIETGELMSWSGEWTDEMGFALYTDEDRKAFGPLPEGTRWVEV